ncbi:hypothetical protein PRIPAC_80749 [Pristionchus pacificus]|uniref:Bestrophin homolog n=1 Tax=Pristionchus pacificus TaxID=54126 RepID=A0A2A6BH45_PRIPA|nr:hypothetical protein PRIPAC_80749 [Pristionchus pacificus]|eukprot:PDM65173.1 hypothetical protein PRIPAC_52115 [Pristionchus pacificus]
MSIFAVAMTISYQTGFFHLIFRWYGSIWRSIYKELTVYLVLFFSIRLFHTLAIPWLDGDGEKNMKVRFEAICRQFDNYTKLIPLTFLLGFYVSNVVSRWWRQFECLNWPEDLLSLLCVCVKDKDGTDDRAHRVRHRIARYLNAKEECPYTRWMTPLHWVQQIMANEVANHDMQVTYLTNFMSELKNFRASFRRLFCHDWVCVPLVYTQVAAIATYGFFFFALFGRQNINQNDVDTIFPIFTVVQFLFFVGWYKVGLDLMRPFGLDDDDIELAYILERNINVSFAIVGKLQKQPPPPYEEDKFLNSDVRIELHSLTSDKTNQKFRGPKLNTYDQLVDLEQSMEEGYEENGRGQKEKMGSFMDVAEKVIKEERRARVTHGLNKWLPTWKEDIPKEKKMFYW